ncbi:MAG: dTMP kinase [Caulobacteraceae bacterium]
MKKRGMILTFEGIDQSGKETQSKMLTKRLRDMGYGVGHIYFPDYETPIGKELRAFLDGKTEYSPIVRQMLYVVNRYEMMDKINKMLEENDFVIADRYIPSGIAYGVVNGIDEKWASSLEKFLPQPDIVIVLDISSEVSRSRKSEEKRDVYEKSYGFLDKVRNTYLELAKEYGWIVVDASETIPEVHKNIWDKFSQYLKKSYNC